MSPWICKKWVMGIVFGGYFYMSTKQPGWCSIIAVSSSGQSRSYEWMMFSNQIWLVRFVMANHVDSKTFLTQNHWRINGCFEQATAEAKHGRNHSQPTVDMSIVRELELFTKNRYISIWFYLNPVSWPLRAVASWRRRQAEKTWPT